MVENVKEAVAEGLKEFFQTQLKPRFDRIDGKLAEHDRRFDQIEVRLAGHDRQLSLMHGKLLDHERQLSSIHEKQEEHDEKFRDIFGHFDQLYQRLTLLKDEYHAIVHGLRRIDAFMESEQENREILERRLEELKSQVDNLQLRIVELEERLMH